MYAFYRWACAHIAQRAWKTRLGIISQMTSLKQLFTVERCQDSALLNIHVSLYFSLDGQMNMLQVSCYTRQNPQTTNQESKTN